MNEKCAKPIIGVIPLYDEKKESIWMLPAYLEGLSRAGAVPIILPLNAGEKELEQLNSIVDGYLMTGGHDVSPSLYGEEKRKNCGGLCQQRDAMEKLIYNFAVSDNKPLLGICRGIQLINVLEGGNLYQDIPTEYKGIGQVEHHMNPPYDRTVHSVAIEKDSPLYELLKKQHISVNSYHHQGIKEIGKKLKIMAVSEDGLVEGLYRPDSRFIWGIQWHPEFIYNKDKDQFKIFEAFISACYIN